MANRLSKIYTRTGDKGTTSLANGQRVSKSDAIFIVMGDIDELNSYIGMAKYHANKVSSEANTVSSEQTDEQLIEQTDIDLTKSLTIIQHLLFNLVGELAMIGAEYAYQGIKPKHVAWLEIQIDQMNAQLQPLKEFILPTGDELMCQLHICRAVCRRAERSAIGLNQSIQTTSLSESTEQALYPTGLKFLNRLSDWLFVASRFAGLRLSEQQIQETLWDKTALNNI